MLKRLQEITRMKMPQLVKMTNISSPSYGYFLINLFNLASKHKRLIYSDLPICFFKHNFNQIISICESDEIDLKHL